MTLLRVILGIAALLSIMACTEKSSQQALVEAKSYNLEGDRKAAIIVLKTAIQKQPTDAELRFQLGKIYIEQSDFVSAEKELSRALSLGFPSAKVIPLLAEAMERSGANVALSELEVETLQLTNIDRLEVGFRQVSSLISLSKKEQALVQLNSLQKINSDSIYKSLLSALKAVIEDDAVDAMVIAEKAYSRSPLNRDVLKLNANLNLAQKNLSKAAAFFSEYEKQAPEDLQSKLLLADLLLQTQQPQKAEKHIDELLNQFSNSPLLHQLKSVTRLAAEDFDKALYHAEKAIISKRNEPVIRFVAGISSFELGAYANAIAHLSVIAPQLPDNHPVLRVLVASQVQLRRAEAAEESLSRISQPEKNDARLFTETSSVLSKAGDIDAAKSILAQAEIITETPQDLTRLGQIKMSINDVTGLADLEKSAALAPTSLNSLSVLAEAYLSLDELDKANKVSQILIQAEGTLVQGLLVGAEIKQKKGDYGKAQLLLSKALELDSSNIDARIADLRLAMRTEDFDLAIQKAEALLAIEPTNIQGLSAMFAITGYLGSIDTAFSYVDKIELTNETEVPVKVLLAEYQLVYQGAVTALKTLRAIDADQTVPNSYWHIKANALVQLGKIEQAKSHYLLWEQTYPYQQLAILGQLSLYDRERKYAAGVGKAQAFLERKESADIRLYHAYFSAMTGNSEVAKESLLRVPSALLDQPFSKGVLARIALLDGRAEEAVKNAKIAYQDADTITNLFLYVQSLDQTQQSELAYNVIIAHTEKYPSDIPARILLGERQIVNDTKAAIANYTDLLNITPDNWIVLNNLSYLQMQAGNLVSAEKNAKTAYELDPTNVAVSDTYAQILMLDKRYNEALKVFEKIMSTNIKNEEVLVRHVEALLRNGDTAVAQRRMEQLSIRQPKFKEQLASLKNEFNL